MGLKTNMLLRPGLKGGGGNKKLGINMWSADRHDSCYMWKEDPPL